MTCSLYREIDALGGVGNGDYHQGFSDALTQVLAILERRGFSEHVEAVPAPPPASTDENGWIEWTGGPCPVERGSGIIVRTADGWVDDSPIGYRFWPDRWWRHQASDSDDNIVAYRVVSK